MGDLFSYLREKQISLGLGFSHLIAIAIQIVSAQQQFPKAREKCVAKDNLDEESPEELKFDAARTKGHRAKVRSVFQEDQPSSVSRMD